MCDTWSIIGSSLSAREWYLRTSLDTTRITCNGGLAICPFPEWCFVLDVIAVKKFEAELKAAKEAGRTRFVCDAARAHTWKRELGFEMDRGLECDQPFPEPGETDPRIRNARYKRDRFLNLSMTGPLMVQFAVAEGARELHIVGFEGYRSTKDAQVVDYFDGRAGSASGVFLTEHRQAALLGSMIPQCPDVEFIFYGDLSYDLGEWPNLRVVTHETD